ncbi:hypothetical protein I4U23_023291 [Adineta vaga]|nr:hypothetical protein I4U23_023291 [Adineta vaga]
MSCNLSIIKEQNEKENDKSIDTYQYHVAPLNHTVYYISSAFTNVQELQTEYGARYQHEKCALAELNKRFRIFVDRVQQLESENAKYIALLTDCRPNIRIIGTESEECYLGVQSDLMKINSEKVNSDLESEFFQLQIGTYKQLVDWKDGRRFKFEQELNQSSSVLTNLRTSYADLQRQVDSVYATWKNTFQQHLAITVDWRESKRQTFALLLSVEALKNQMIFYKNLVSYLEQFESFTVDFKQFSTLEFDKIVKKIRLDFEQFYRTVGLKLTEYYQTKMEQLKTEVKKIVDYQQSEVVVTQGQTLNAEYKQVQKIYSDKKEVIVKLEATYSKLESELQSIQIENQQKLESQTKDLQSLQESIMTVVYNIDEAQQRKIELESEIIVYCNLLDASQIQNQQVIVSSCLPIESTTTRKTVVRTNNKGSISIQCPPDGTYISLMNHSKSEKFNISRWILKRRLDSKREFRYTLPDQVLLEPGRELRIYSKQGVSANKVPPIGHCIISSLRQEYINNNLDSWGICNTAETLLFNENGEEKAFYSQAIAPD